MESNTWKAFLSDWIDAAPARMVTIKRALRALAKK
jgi:hypothetical protein